LPHSHDQPSHVLTCQWNTFGGVQRTAVGSLLTHPYRRILTVLYIQYRITACTVQLKNITMVSFKTNARNITRPSMICRSTIYLVYAKHGFEVDENTVTINTLFNRHLLYEYPSALYALHSVNKYFGLLFIMHESYHYSPKAQSASDDSPEERIVSLTRIFGVNKSCFV
jgi:hypothetical protein